MENQLYSLSGKRIVILGGSTGLGFATAKAAAAEGANVIIVSSRKERIDSALKDLPKTAEGHALDLSKEENIKSFFEKTGNFDHLVFTAGENLSFNTLAETEIAKAKTFFDLRFWGAVAAVKYASPLINKGGSISLTSGTAGKRPGKGWTVMAAICLGMEGFVKALAVELAPIRVNCVMPGIVKTNLWDGMAEADRESLYKTYADALLVKRIGESEDIAQTYIYLMKQQYGTGQTLIVDGGGVLI